MLPQARAMIRHDPSNVSIYFQLYSKEILSHAAALNLPAVSEGGERRRRGSLTRMIKGKASQPAQADVTTQREVPPASHLCMRRFRFNICRPRERNVLSVARNSWMLTTQM